MRYLFRPNSTILLKRGTYESTPIRAHARLGSGTLVEESQAVILDGRTIFDFYDVHDMSVLDGSEWRLIDDSGITHKKVFASRISGNLVRVVAERDSSVSKRNMNPVILGIAPGYAYGIDPHFAWAVGA